MNILFNNNELLQLLTNLYTLTGIRANIFDLSGKDICLTDDHTPFCEKINACPEGHARCVACDAQAVKHCRERKTPYFYRCHAGICEAVIPVYANGVPVAYLAFGQILDHAPIEEQWERTRATLDWYPGGAEALEESFFRFRQYSDQELTAFAEVLKALSSHIHISGLIQTAEYNDLQRLEIYLDQHYTERVSLATISEALDISRSRLCVLAKQLSGGQTLSRMIAERRVEAAKRLLMKTDRPISEVAEAVGMIDYNYFTKIFRTLTGITPSAFRNQYRNDATLEKTLRTKKEKN